MDILHTLPGKKKKVEGAPFKEEEEERKKRRANKKKEVKEVKEATQ